MDTIKRLSVIIVASILAGYTMFLISVGQVITLDIYSDESIVVGIIIVLLSIYMAFVYGIKPTKFSTSKISLLGIGVIMILVGQYILRNDVSNLVFMSDVVKFIGVLVVLFGATGVIITDSIKNKKKDDAMEIIEV